jgi:hypothetical protein
MMRYLTPWLRRMGRFNGYDKNAAGLSGGTFPLAPAEA